MNQKQTLIIGSILGFLGVAFGAFGAHALKSLLIENGRLDTYELAVRYQFYHAFGLLAIGLLMEKLGATTLRWASLFTVVGVLLFCGSLYLFAITNTTAFAMVTPFGGLFLLIGWSAIIYAIASAKRT